MIGLEPGINPLNPVLGGVELYRGPASREAGYTQMGELEKFFELDGFEGAGSVAFRTIS